LIGGIPAKRVVRSQNGCAAFHSTKVLRLEIANKVFQCQLTEFSQKLNVSLTQAGAPAMGTLLNATNCN
jgi:hypothetical protein